MIFVDHNNEIAERVIAGEHDAQMQLLKRYDGYINKAATVTAPEYMFSKVKMDTFLTKCNRTFKDFMISPRVSFSHR